MTLLDTSGMFDAAAALPEQLAIAARSASEVEGLPSGDAIANVVLFGMGGSGLAGDVLTVVAGPFMPVPVVVHKGYGIPNFIGSDTLVFAVSFSGNTEETIEAATEAYMAGANMVVVSGGGALAQLAEEWAVPRVPIADGIPMPRAAPGAVAVPPLVVLERMGLFPGAHNWVAAAVAQLQVRRDELIKDGSSAAAMARRLERQFPVIYGGGGIGAAAAARWKNQFNENAKVAAWHNVVPELTHNEICGWGQHGDVTRQIFRLFELRHEFEHPQIARRFDFVNDVVSEVVAGIEVVDAEGDGPLAQLFDLMMIGDFVTLHAAAVAGIDPGPVPVLDDIKAALAVD